MSSEKRKIAYIDGKPYEIGSKHTSILKFVKSYLGDKTVPTLCDDPNLAPYGACRVCSVEVALKKDGPTKVVASCHTPVGENQHRVAACHDQLAVSEVDQAHDSEQQCNSERD